MPGLSGVGAGMDSFFEYGVKAGIMLGELKNSKSGGAGLIGNLYR